MNIQEIATQPQAEFLMLLLNDGIGERDNCIDFMDPNAMKFLKGEITKRKGEPQTPDSQLSSQFVIQQAAYRYFALLLEARQSLQGLFTESEFLVMLNTTCSSIWESLPGTRMASLVAGDNGVDSLSDLPKGSELRLLLLKLVELDSMQNAALFDLCETCWRHLAEGSLAEVLEGLHVRLEKKGA